MRFSTLRASRLSSSQRACSGSSLQSGTAPIGRSAIAVEQVVWGVRAGHARAIDVAATLDGSICSWITPTLSTSVRPALSTMRPRWDGIAISRTSFDSAWAM